MKILGHFGVLSTRFGLTVTLHAAGSPYDNMVYRAFIQPLRYKNKMYLDGKYSPIGYLDQAHYLYIGPPNIDITSLPDGAYITFRGKNYNFTRREEVAVQDQCVYYWSVLRAMQEEAV